MEIITIISILLPYAILLLCIVSLGRKQQQLRIDFYKKLVDSQTEQDNIFIDFQKAVIENFKIANENNKGQDENWRRAKKKFDKLDRINQEHLEIFQEFDYIIQELDKKVNEVSDEQEEILMRKELDTQQINIVCEKLEKLTLKRDRYENRLTEVCKAFDALKDVMNKNTKLTVDNFGSVNRAFGSVARNFNGIEGLPKKVDEIDRTLNRVIQRQLQRQSETKKLKEVLENPIEVTRPSCETKLKLKEQVNQNDVESVTEIVNKVDFKHSHGSFKKGDIFILDKDDLKVYRNKILLYDYNSWTTFGKNVMKKLLQLNEN